jgi:hypothetical protein
MTMRTVTDAERRARLGVRHHLARPGPDAVAVAGDLAGLHSSDPTTVFLTARSRVRGFRPVDLERALYEDRSLLRMLVMRRTLFVVPRSLAGQMDVACARPLAAAERRRLARMLAEQGVTTRPERWIAETEAQVLEALADGELSAPELTARVPRLGRKLTFGEGSRWQAEVGVSTRILFLLAGEAKVVRARPRGSWTSGQYRWARIDRWLGEPLVEPDPDEAAAAVLAAWLRACGPATMTDVRWWTGWTARRSTATLGAVGAERVALEDGTPAYLLPGDERPPRPRPWVALLPALDPTTMAWKERAWFLGPHAGRLFDRNGNAGPTIWADGRVVGGWGQAPDGEIRLELLEVVRTATRRRIDAEAARLAAWLGDVRFRPRFTSPLERTLVGS